jgi:hypothetical protein
LVGRGWRWQFELGFQATKGTLHDDLDHCDLQNRVVVVTLTASE